MAQLGGAQREPSMEEILASIRRIIEDSDPVRRPESYVQPVRPDNDVPPQLLSKAVAEASVIEVDAFRGSRLDDAVASASAVSADLADEAKNEAMDAGVFMEPAMASVQPEATLAADVRLPSPDAVQQDAADAGWAEGDDWRLGVSAPEILQGPENMDFDLDDVADAVLRDITSVQSAGSEDRSALPQSDLPEPEPVLDPGPADPARPPLVSDRTGRQVAASFSELSDALAARNRKNLDEMAEEMLRPMLRDWLDSNLPALVERLVREEIERIAQASAA